MALSTNERILSGVTEKYLDAHVLACILRSKVRMESGEYELQLTTNGNH